MHIPLLEDTSRSLSNIHAKIFGLSIYKRGRKELLHSWQTLCQKGSGKQTAFFVNAHTVNTMYENPRFRRTLEFADVLLPDGIGIEIAARSTGQRLDENLCGTDLILDICRSSEPFRMYFVGGRPGVAEGAAAYFCHAYDAQVVGTHHGYLKDASEEELEELWRDIAQTRPDIVLIGMGVPIQEDFVVRFRHRMEAPLVMAVGGLFDYYAGCVKRAPLLWRRLRMEWLFRLMQEPRRLWRRYLLGNPLFLLHTARMVLSSRLRRAS